MRRAKNLGVVEPSQKKITHFFAKKPESNNNRAENKQSQQPCRSSKSVNKTRRNTTSLRPPNFNRAIDYVDLVDSDEEASFPHLLVEDSSGSGSTASANVRTANTIKLPEAPAIKVPCYVDLREFKSELPSESSRIGEFEGSRRKALRVKNEVEDCAEREEDIYENSTQTTGTRGCEDEKDEGLVDELKDTDTECSPERDIRVVSFSKILEDSQSSQEESAPSYFMGFDEETQRIPEAGSSRGIRKVDDFSLAMKSPLLCSPVKKKSTFSRNSSSSSTTSSPTKRKTPLKSPKTRVNHFSPVRQLQYKSRSFSKTPTKNPASSTGSQKSPFRNPAVKSPLKALWASSPIPYYLKNFSTVLNSVAEDDHNSHLLNDDDTEIIQKFRSLTRSAQCLYVRLIGRKWEWKKASTIKYEQISLDLIPTLQELHTHKFLQEINEVDLDLEELLDLISHDRMSELCKQMKIKVPSNSKSKEKCIAFLIKNCQQQQTLTGSMTVNLKKAALKEVSPAYKVTEASKSLFSRVFIVYHPPQYWEQDSDKDALQLLSILLAELGKVTYPEYKISKSQHIYEDREDLLRFQEAWGLHSQIQAYTLSKQWEEVVDVAKESMTKFKQLLEVPKIVEYSKKLPDYLRAYTAGSLLARVCWLGVDGFQKLKDYSIANEYLNFLLSQKVYLTHYHGRWYERLVLNSKHLREENGKIREIIETALSCPNVGDNHKLDLSARLTKLKAVVKKKRKIKKRKPKRRPKRKKANEEWEEAESSSSNTDSSEDDEIDIDIDPANCVSLSTGSYLLRNKVPERTIEGEKMQTYDREYGKSVFLGTGGRSLSSVEKFAMTFYESQGYNYGIHAEGAVASTIYGLLFWSVIYYDEIPDVFYSPYQASPLDFHFGDFRTRRQHLIDEQMKNLKSNWSVEEVIQVMERTWTEKSNQLSIVSWSLFENFEHLKILVRSMGLPVIAGICDRLSQNYRYYRSGFPDLIVWGDNKCRFAEVKGPGDSLSAKQRLWLDYLISLQADAEICHVKSVSNKRIRPGRSS